MERSEALAVVAAIDEFGIRLGSEVDTWSEYVRAMKVLGRPVDLHPIEVESTLPISTEPYPWEREVLLPVIQPLVLEWVKLCGLRSGGQP